MCAAIGFEFTDTSKDQEFVHNERTVFTASSPGKGTIQVGLHPEVVFTILPPSSGWRSFVDQGDPRNKTWLAPDSCEAGPHVPYALNVTFGFHEFLERPISLGEKIKYKRYDRCRRLLQCSGTFPSTVGGLRSRTSEFCLLIDPKENLQGAHLLVNNQSHVCVCQLRWESTMLNTTSVSIRLHPIPIGTENSNNKDKEDSWLYLLDPLVDIPGYVDTNHTCRHRPWVKYEVVGDSTSMNLDIKCFQSPIEC